MNALSEIDPRAVYAATKRAIAIWTTEQAVDHERITRRQLVNAVAPGLIKTGMTAEIRADPERLAAAFARMPHPMGAGDSEDVAGAIA